MIASILANFPTAADLLVQLRRRTEPDHKRFRALSIKDMEMKSKTYGEGYLDGLTHSQSEVERLRGELDHAIRISEQTAQVMREDRQKNPSNTINTYQDGYLDGLLRSQGEIERLRGEVDHMLRVLEQTARVLREEQGQDDVHTIEMKT